MPPAVTKINKNKNKHKNQSEGTDDYWGINAKRCNSALALSRKLASLESTSGKSMGTPMSQFLVVPASACFITFVRAKAWMWKRFFPDWGTPIWKERGCLWSRFRGVNFEFWSHLGCSGKTLSYLAVKI